MVYLSKEFESQTKQFEKQRLRMVEEQIAGRDVANRDVLEAMRKVPRHFFVPENLLQESYQDYPLSIGEGQTISQPYIVALMTELLNPAPEDRILEIGTGSGYQTAIIAGLVHSVFTVERIESLLDRARMILATLDIFNIHYRLGNGYDGWMEKGPFDGILSAASPEKLPESFIRQLKTGGKIVLPVGSIEQTLMRYTKMKDGSLFQESVIPVRFVPMVED